MNTEHEEAQTAQLTEYEEGREAQRRSVSASIWHTECASALLEAKAGWWKALGACITLGTLTGMGWSIWWWIHG